jgi:AcrR family transcriptional regulator
MRDVKENRKEDIFTAAVACFNENGYYKASMDMIAERARMTKRGLYYHFKSKDQLFIELFKYMNRKYYAQIPAYVTAISDPEERMMHFVEIANKVLMENTDFLKFTHEFMSIGLRKPAIREVMTSYYNDQVEKVQKTIENGIKSGKFIQIDSKAIARAIVLITIGAFNAYFTLDTDFDLAQQHNFNITHMLKGLIKV